MRQLVRSILEGGGARPVVVWHSPWPVALLVTAFLTAFLLVGVPAIVSRPARILGLPGGLVWFLDYGVTVLLVLLAAGWLLA